MNCLPCFNGDDDDDEETGQDAAGGTSGQDNLSAPTAKPYTFRELAMSTKNFRQECLLGEGGFGRVFKGKLSDDEVVAVKQLDRNGMQENKEFVNEVMKLSRVHHPNLVNLIGYCADGDQRLLVYEYMSNGSLENHLFGDGPEPLNWTTRMKIAAGAAEGLQYLHESARPPIIYRDLKPSNILLNENYDPKLSDVGLAQLGPGGGGNNPASRVMGTYGYSAPEYSSNGELSLKSDVYSFGVVLLELITGRRAVDTTRPSDEQNLVTWAQPIFRDPKRFPEMADPQLNKHFPEKSLNQAVGIAAMCLQEESMVRPLIADIVPALSFICMTPPTVAAPAATSELSESSSVTPPPDQKMEKDINAKHDGSESSSSSRSGGNNRDNDDKESQSDDRGSGESSSEEGNSKDGSRISSSSRSTSRSSPRAKKNSRQPMVTFKEPGSRYSTSSESDEGGTASKEENGSNSREGEDDSSSDD